MTALWLPSVIGHRGAAALAPENTLAGLRAAARLGVRMVEFDAKLSADGVPILMHDATLDRTTDGTGPVRDVPLSVLAGLDAGGWFDPAFAGEPVPTLAQALETCRDLDLAANVEIKPCAGRERATAEAVIEVIRRTCPGGGDGVLVTSFVQDALAVAKRAAPTIPRGLLMRAPPADWSEPIGRLAPATVHLDRQAIATDVVAGLKRRGLPVLAYTVNDAAIARNLFDLGVDAVFSDTPDLIMPVAP